MPSMCQERWHLWCINEDGWVNCAWQDAGGPAPTECPNNPAHSIRAVSIETPGVPEKTAPVAADLLKIEDSEDDDKEKSARIDSLIGARARADCVRITRGDDPYWESSWDTYEDASLLIYDPGETGAATSYKVIVSASDTNPTADVRIYHPATSNVIAEKAGITFAAADTYYAEDLGAVSNLPASGIHIFAVQLRRASGSGPDAVRISFAKQYY